MKFFKEALVVFAFILCFAVVSDLGYIYAEGNSNVVSREIMTAKFDKKMDKVEAIVKDYKDGGYVVSDNGVVKRKIEPGFIVICVFIAIVVIGVAYYFGTQGALIILIVSSAAYPLLMATVDPVFHSLFSPLDSESASGYFQELEELKKFEQYMEEKTLDELNKPYTDTKGSGLVKLYEGKYYLYMDEKYDSIKTEEYTDTEYNAIMNDYIRGAQ